MKMMTSLYVAPDMSFTTTMEPTKKEIESALEHVRADNTNNNNETIEEEAMVSTKTSIEAAAAAVVQQNISPLTDIPKETDANETNVEKTAETKTTKTTALESQAESAVPNALKTKIPFPTITTNQNINTNTSKAHQLQRSASLRLRIAKSNMVNTSHPPLLSDKTFSKVETERETHYNPLHNRRGSVGVPNGVVYEQNVNGTHVDTSSTLAGRNSLRRKLVLNSLARPALDLTRSLSLRRQNNCQTSHKTDANKESCKTGRDGSNIECDIAVTGTQNAEDLNVKNLCINAEPEQETKTFMANGNIIGNNDSQNSQNMSLNINGTSLTSTSTNSTGNALTTRVQQRPATLVTGNGTGNELKNSAKSPIAAVKTSKTNRSPITPITPLTPDQHQHNSRCGTKHNCVAVTSETKLTPKTPPVTPDSPCTYLDDDIDSMYSFATTTSGRSTMSCEHPYVARNGTTFSGRKMKYVVHCSNYAGQVGPDYLTPTQRAQRQLRRLKELLCSARQDLEQKDSEILRLTREVVELRLFKASLSSPEERSASSDAVTVREAELKTSQDVSPIVDMVDDANKTSPQHQLYQQTQPQHELHHHTHLSTHSQQLVSEMQSSFADSGHFEDMHPGTPSMSASASACGSDEATNAAACAATIESSSIENYELQRQELIRLYEQRIEDLIRSQDSSTSDMKRSHNDKVEALLQKLAECNTRYADIVPDYEHAKERIRELEKQLEDLQRKLIEHEEKQNKMYLHMYQKGQEAERIARADQALELAHRAPSNKVSINELLHQLQSTQDELENIRAAEYRNECGSNHALLTAKEAISLWVLGARKTIYRRLLEAQKNRTHVDPEVTLQFLKSAVYYFLTDKENSQGHLQAIESILEFTEAEKQNIDKARTSK